MNSKALMIGLSISVMALSARSAETTIHGGTTVGTSGQTDAFVVGKLRVGPNDANAPTNGGTHSLAIGYSTDSPGAYSYALGNGASAGSSTILGSANSFALGYQANSTGAHSFAIGASSAVDQLNNTAGAGRAKSSFAIGESAKIRHSDFGYAIGYQALVEGVYAGNGDLVAGITGGFAIGSYTHVNAANGFAIGSYCDTTAAEGFAIGYANTAEAKGSMALGYRNTTSGEYATTLGLDTTAQAYGSFVMGRWNVLEGSQTSWVANDPLFVIANGTTDTTRSNALTVRKNGNTDIAGSLNAVGQITQGGVAVLTQNSTFTGTKTFSLGTVTGGRAIVASGDYTDILNEYQLSRHLATFNPSSANGYSVSGLMGRATATGSHDLTRPVTSMGGLTGVYGNCQNAGSGTVAGAVAVAGYVSNISSGTIENAVALYGASPGVSGSGVINNAYGLYIKDQSPTGVTGIGYGVYVTATDNVSVLAGPTRIGGTADPASGVELDVTGDAAISGNLILGRYNEAPVVSNPPGPTDDLLIIGDGVDAQNPSNALVVKRNGVVQVGEIEIDPVTNAVRVPQSGDITMGDYQ